MNPLRIPKIRELDLRPLTVIVDEWNRKHPDRPIAIWSRKAFEESMRRFHW